MQFGFGVLHLSSDAFWKMTPRELAQAIIAVRGRTPAPIERGEFDALMKAFPDGSSFRDAPTELGFTRVQQYHCPSRQQPTWMAQTRNPAPCTALDSGFARSATKLT
jgi:uncharacterized phage protein (TIGR02216 family)